MRTSTLAATQYCITNNNFSESHFHLTLYKYYFNMRKNIHILSPEIFRTPNWASACSNHGAGSPECWHFDGDGPTAALSCPALHVVVTIVIDDNSRFSLTNDVCNKY